MKSSMPPLLLSVILLISAQSLPEAASSSAAASFFIFGDSIVDPGNNNYIATVPEFRADYPPYGQNGYFEAPTGRFTDGRVMVDFIAERAKLPIIPAFMQQPSASFRHGANFASGGAGVLPDTSQGLVISFQTQLKQFETVVGSLAAELGDANATELVSEAVYFISIGSNDYILNYMLAGNHQIYPPEEFVAMVIGNLTQSIQELYGKGARKFYILRTVSLGCLPAFRAINPNADADGGCFEDLSAIAMAHNNALSAVLTSLQYLLKGFEYANFDLYGWLAERMDHPTKYGFKDGINACCGAGPYGGTYSCGGTKNVSDFKLCENPEDHIWWDSIHATEKLHEQAAEAIWSEPSTTSPNAAGTGGASSLKDLFFSSEKAKIADIGDESYHFVA